ncbi:MAG: hypothetical protein OEV60_08200 [Actinomycetota bacterium]|nr:hypothetical protein [Actinomycetota bacterium]MDH5224273.1 hypothetical protein [Actinomycetota bacterium]
MMRGRSLAPVFALAVGASIVAACGSPSYEYVRNTEARTAFKVPIEWTVFDEQTLQGEQAGPPVNTPDPVEWLIGLDADPVPAVDHVMSQGNYYSDYPQGIAAVLRLTQQQRDGISYGALRNLIVPLDQIQDQVGREAVQLLSYDDHIEKDGFRGVHLEAQIWASALEGDLTAGGGDVFFDDRFVQISQTAYMDPASDKVYVLAVLCSAECYGRNRGDIESVINSWAVIG